MTLRALGTFGFALTVLAMPVAANAQRVIDSDEKGARQLVAQSHKSKKLVASARNRVNRYFRDAAATPTLRECWSRLQGVGGVAFEFTYRKSESRWVFENAALIKSNLPAGQDEVALRCMRDSIATTSFPVKDTDLRETYAKALVVRWTWPVPLPPKDAKAVPLRGGGGLPDSLVCQICDWRGGPPYGLGCISSNAGYSDCRSDINTPNKCSYSKPCLTGTFGTSGGFVIY
ncbi:MAG: hypothetical protein WAU74_13300 [Pseudolabrys sp.]